MNILECSSYRRRIVRNTGKRPCQDLIKTVLQREEIACQMTLGDFASVNVHFRIDLTHPGNFSFSHERICVVAAFQEIRIKISGLDFFDFRNLRVSQYNCVNAAFGIAAETRLQKMLEIVNVSEFSEFSGAHKILL